MDTSMKTTTKTSKWNVIAAGAARALVIAGTAGAANLDFGAWVEKRMHEMSDVIFGIAGPLAAPAPSGLAVPYRTASQRAGDQILLARGLKAEYVSRVAADALDQFSFWPDAEHPQYIVACIDGGLYEFLDPAHTENLTVLDRSTGEIATPDGAPSTLARKQKALPVMAYEGIGLTPDGVFYGGDELRPGTGTKDKDGGALFKFVPAVPYAGGGIGSLDQSPLASGRIYALQVRASTTPSSPARVAKWATGPGWKWPRPPRAGTRTRPAPPATTVPRTDIWIRSTKTRPMPPPCASAGPTPRTKTPEASAR